MNIELRNIKYAAFASEETKAHTGSRVDGRTTIDGVDLTSFVRIAEVGNKPDRLKVQVGSNYRSRNQINYPPKKNGHDYDTIALHLIRHAAAVFETQMLNQQRAANNTAVADFKTKHGIAQYASDFQVFASSNPEQPLKIKVEFSTQMDADAAAALLSTLRDAGVVRPFAEKHNNEDEYN